MQYILIVLFAVLLLLIVLLLLTGGKLSRLAQFFVEELDENHIPVHPIRLGFSHSNEKEAEEAEEAPPVVRKTAPPKARAAGKMPVRNTSGNSRPRPAPKQGAHRNPNQAYTEIAILTHKIDERRRIVDSNGHSTLFNEYFELVFETRRGETLHLITNRAAFKETPFNQDGALTYKHGRLLRFKYAHGIVNGEAAPPSNP